jgi:hypothetical protein
MLKDYDYSPLHYRLMHAMVRRVCPSPQEIASLLLTIFLFHETSALLLLNAQESTVLLSPT